MQKIIIVTRNLHKYKELSKILYIPDVEFLPLSNFSQIEKIDENGRTFEENALIKARFVNERTGIVTLADDSGLEIKAMGGKPGINSARFMGENTDYKIKNAKILDNLKFFTDSEREACFVCAIAICFNENNYQIATGVIKGMIAHEIRGNGGFGYDPIFFVPEYQKTFGELDENIKNKISHRAIALNKAEKVIKNHLTFLKK